MGKWSGYDWVVVAVRPVGGEDTISHFKIRRVFGSSLGKSTVKPRAEVLHDHENGQSYVTAQQGERGLEPIDEVKVVESAGEPFLRVREDARDNDYLGELPEF